MGLVTIVKNMSFGLVFIIVFIDAVLHSISFVLIQNIPKRNEKSIYSKIMKSEDTLFLEVATDILYTDMNSS